MNISQCKYIVVKNNNYQPVKPPQTAGSPGFTSLAVQRPVLCSPGFESYPDQMQARFPVRPAGVELGTGPVRFSQPWFCLLYIYLHLIF
jgi:hypothetical protein